MIVLTITHCPFCKAKLISLQSSNPHCNYKDCNSKFTISVYLVKTTFNYDRYFISLMDNIMVFYSIKTSRLEMKYNISDLDLKEDLSNIPEVLNFILTFQ